MSEMTSRVQWCFMTCERGHGLMVGSIKTPVWWHHKRKGLHLSLSGFHWCTDSESNQWEHKQNQPTQECLCYREVDQPTMVCAMRFQAPTQRGTRHWRWLQGRLIGTRLRMWRQRMPDVLDDLNNAKQTIPLVTTSTRLKCSYKSMRL